MVTYPLPLEQTDYECKSFQKPLPVVQASPLVEVLACVYSLCLYPTPPPIFEAEPQISDGVPWEAREAAICSWVPSSPRSERRLSAAVMSNAVVVWQGLSREACDLGGFE